MSAFVTRPHRQHVHAQLPHMNISFAHRAGASIESSKCQPKEYIRSTRATYMQARSEQRIALSAQSERSNYVTHKHTQQRRIKFLFVFWEKSRKLPRIQLYDLAVRTVIWAPHVKCERVLRPCAWSQEGEWVKLQIPNHRPPPPGQKYAEASNIIIMHSSKFLSEDSSGTIRSKKWQHLITYKVVIYRIPTMQ
jgi:hypothetical protein